MDDVFIREVVHQLVNSGAFVPDQMVRQRKTGAGFFPELQRFMLRYAEE
jgi:hypothetical protein